MTLKKMMAASLLLLLVAACGGAKKEQHGAGQTDATDAERTERLKPRYAEGFSLRSEGGVWLVDIQDPRKVPTAMPSCRAAVISGRLRATSGSRYPSARWSA